MKRENRKINLRRFNSCLMTVLIISRNTCTQQFINYENKTSLSNLFADWLNYGTPLSIVEGLNERFKFYKRVIKNWNIHQIHSAIGFFYNENINKLPIIFNKNDNIARN